MVRTILVICGWVFFCTCLPAQVRDLSNLRSKLILPLSTPQILDSLTVISSSIQASDPATGEKISPENFSLDNNRIIFDSAFAIHHSSFIILKYRVLPFDFEAPLARLDTAVLQKNGDILIGYRYDPFAQNAQPLLPNKGLDYNGNYTRGISFGNNQSLVLNSQFNLQMAGNLGDVEVLAAMTDNNIPLQPEGNTAQLREFDRIFIQLSKKNNRLIAGDYELTKPPGYFMNYYKKLQGATFSRQVNLGGNLKLPPKLGNGGGRSPSGVGGGFGTLETKGSVAIARGKFARNSLSAQEGNQGPYRLEGAEGERFIIVLAGTEKVFLDGQLLRRGLDADYVIDYNAGHITFTSRRLITKDSRMVVEFEYNVQDFQRSLYAANADWRLEKSRFYLNAYSEQDSRQPLDDEFSDFELETLHKAGDQALDAVVSSIDTVEEFSAFRVLYRLADTTANGILYSNVLIFSTDRDSAKYSAGFSFVGFGNGNYVLDTESAANGRVYRWVAPDPATGQAKGEYEPVRRLVAPVRQQLFTAGWEAEPYVATKLRGEVALSNFDQNRLSPQDDSDNYGVAATAGVRRVFEIKSKKWKGKNHPPLTPPAPPQGGLMPPLPDTLRALFQTDNQAGTPPPLRGGRGGDGVWRLETELDYEFSQKKFKELNPYRPAEFTRDWNVNQSANDISTTRRLTNEHLASAGFTLRSPSAGSLQYRFGGFFRDSLYTGTKHFARYAYLEKGYEIWAQGDFLTTKSTAEKSQFNRPKFNFAVPFLRDSTGSKFWRAGIFGEREQNRRFAKTAQNGFADTLNRSSFFYDLAKIYLESPENERFNFKANALRRFDYAPAGSDFSASTIADEASISGNWQQSRNSRLGWNFTYRNLTVRDTSLTNLDPTQTYLGRLDYSLNLLRGVVQSSTSYEIGAGQERKVEFTYLEVPPGEGTHQWIDRNEDEKVQVDEVEIAPFPDLANVVRLTVFTDDFIRTDNVVFNQSLRLEPKAVWFNAKGARRFLSKFSTQSSLQINRKVRKAEGVSPWNPFQFDIADTALVATRSIVYNTLFFNRSDPKYDLQLGMSDNQNKVVQTTGFESRRLQEQTFKARWNVTKTISLQAAFTKSLDEQGSEQFENRRYKIRSQETKPTLTWQPSNSFRTAASWRYEFAKNALGTKESARTNDLKVETTYSRSATTSIRSEVSWVRIDFSGGANSPVGFALLQGLQPGENWLWNLTVERQVGKNIRVGVTYEGRKTGMAGLVHVGRAQVGAVF